MTGKSEATNEPTVESLFIQDLVKDGQLTEHEGNILRRAVPEMDEVIFVALETTTGPLVLLGNAFDHATLVLLNEYKDEPTAESRAFIESMSPTSRKHDVQARHGTKILAAGTVRNLNHTVRTWKIHSFGRAEELPQAKQPHLSAAIFDVLRERQLNRSSRSRPSVLASEATV